MRVAWISLAVLLGFVGRVGADAPSSSGPIGPMPAPIAPVAAGPIGPGPVGLGPVGPGPVGPGPVGLGPVGPVGPGPVGPRPVGFGPVIAPRVVLLTDRAEVHEPALAITLGGALIIALPPPAGELLLDRAAAVQRAAVEAGAEAGVWIDGGDVCVVSADGRALHRAPLPPGGSPRAFAAIARSLLDEAFAGPPGADIRVDVHFDVNAPGSAPPAIAPVAAVGGVVGAIAGAGAASDGAAVVAGTTPPLWNRHLLELGAMVSPVTIGLEAEVAWSVSPRWRFGMLAMINALPFAHPASLMWGSGAEIRRVGRGTRHFDIGMLGGAGTADGDTAGFLSVRLGWVWERTDTGFGFSICPTLVFIDRVFPAVWASLRWELPV